MPKYENIDLIIIYLEVYEVISPQHCVTHGTYRREAIPERNEMNCETKHSSDTVDRGIEIQYGSSCFTAQMYYTDCTCVVNNIYSVLNSIFFFRFITNIFG